MKQHKAIEVSFNPYEVMHHLKTANLIIDTIPGEQWTLSAARHKQLLVDVYSLSGRIASMKRNVTFTSGLLSQVLLKLLRTARKAAYRSFLDRDENVSAFATNRGYIGETLEEDITFRLQSGDVIFGLIEGESWRLTSTWFGHSLNNSGPPLYKLAEESTLGTPDIRLYQGSNLTHVLLEFLCQKSHFVEQGEQKVLQFARKENT